MELSDDSDLSPIDSYPHFRPEGREAEEVTLSNGECRRAVYLRLHHMMKMAQEVALETNNLSKVLHAPRIQQHRANAVKWIKEVILIVVIHVTLSLFKD